MPRTTLVFNVGSSSVKWALARGRHLFIQGVIEPFGSRTTIQTVVGRKVRRIRSAVPTVRAAFAVVRRLVSEQGIQPTTIAHRIVHGGQRLRAPTRLTPAILRELHALVPLAPLHQPSNLLGVTMSRRAWPTAAQWGVFDTALFRQLPLAARTYALPRQLTARLTIERFGFHGTSHAWAFQQAAKLLRRTARQCSVVTLHLGAGVSGTAWSSGRPVDTTMGFTPLEGPMMATRSGSLDPAIPLYLQEQLGWSVQRVRRVLERESGWFGLTGFRDFRDVLRAAGHSVPGWPGRRWSATTRMQARLTLDVFCFQLRRIVAGYLGLIEPAQAIVFTGQIGQNRLVQRLVLKGLPSARRLRRLTIRTNEAQAIVAALPAR